MSTASRFGTFHVASKSPLKLLAVEAWVASRIWDDANKSDGAVDRAAVSRVVPVAEPVSTSCPQPVGLDAAVECIGERMRAFDKEPALRSDVYLAIENYIEVGSTAVRDRCAVAASYVNRDGFWVTRLHTGRIAVVVPPEFLPKQSDEKTALGFSVTVGSLINAARPECAADNWAADFYGDPTLDRVDQIIDALKGLDLE
jgi:hypothetical protein